MGQINLSKQLFYQLADQLKSNIVALSVSESDKWCGLYQKSGKRFAYILVTKHKPKIDVWCLGERNYIEQKYAGRIKFLNRQVTVGSFGNQFQISFMVENNEDIKNAVELLTEISDSWTREELISAYNLYCKIPINEITSNNINIIKFAELLDKTPKEVAKRFKNFAKLDSGISEAKNINWEDKNVWQLFKNDWEKIVYESEDKIIDLENKLNKIAKFPKGEERDSLVKARVNQSFFRSAVLTSYHSKCCITGLPFPELLNASHIVPWSVDINNRLNPHNGVCLNALHDRAFDKGLITIKPDYSVDVSKSISDYLDNQAVKNYFMCYKNKHICLPQRFLPDKNFLIYHNKNIFKK